MARGAAGPGRGARPTTRGGAVVVVEDHPDLAALLTDELTDAGYAVTATGSALGAVALARRVRPRAVVLDLGLPYRSGVALLAELKADPRTAAIPVVVVSAYTDQLSAEQVALTAAVIPKPFPLDALLAALRAPPRAP